MAWLPTIHVELCQDCRKLNNGTAGSCAPHSSTFYHALPSVRPSWLLTTMNGRDYRNENPGNDRSSCCERTEPAITELSLLRSGGTTEAESRFKQIGRANIKLRCCSDLRNAFLIPLTEMKMCKLALKNMPDNF